MAAGVDYLANAATIGVSLLAIWLSKRPTRAHLAEPDWLGMLAAIGIAKGQPFNPDARTRSILDCANLGLRWGSVNEIIYLAPLPGICEIMPGLIE